MKVLQCGGITDLEGGTTPEARPRKEKPGENINSVGKKGGGKAGAGRAHEQDAGEGGRAGGGVEAPAKKKGRRGVVLLPPEMMARDKPTGRVLRGNRPG